MNSISYASRCLCKSIIWTHRLFTACGAYTHGEIMFLFRTHLHLCNVVALRLRKLSLSRSPSLFALNLPLYWCYSRGQCVRKNTHINLANAIAMERVSDFVPGEYFSHHIISVKFESDRWLEKRESILYSETTTSYVSANSILPTRLPVPAL